MKKITTTAAPESDEDGTSEDCPEPDGYFADADQCDKYYACNDGRIEGELLCITKISCCKLEQPEQTTEVEANKPNLLTERLCKDGLVFNDYDINVEKCDLPYNLDCTKKWRLREFELIAQSPLSLN